MKRSPTMRDVAEAARVSQRTVSNVVNEYAHVAPQTRQRVLEAIEKLGYLPNIAAQNLRTGRTSYIALVVPRLSWPYFGEIAHLVQKEASRLGYTVMVVETEGERSQEVAALRHFGSNRVDGMILSPIELTEHDLQKHKPIVPVVLIGEQIRESNLPHFEIDSIAAGNQIARHLVDMGARSFLILGSTTTTMTSGPGPLRYEGFHQGLEMAGIPEVEVRKLPSSWTYRSAHRTISKWLSDSETTRLPDALITMNDIMAAGAIRALADNGLMVPDDILVTGWDDTSGSAYMIPSLTTIRPDKRAIANLSVSTLTSLFSGAEPESTPDPIQHELIVRESSTPVPNTNAE